MEGNPLIKYCFTGKFLIKFKYSNTKIHIQYNIYFVILLLTITYSFLIITIIYSVENEQIINRQGNTPYNVLGMPHNTFLI